MGRHGWASALSSNGFVDGVSSGGEFAHPDSIRAAINRQRRRLRIAEILSYHIEFFGEARKVHVRALGRGLDLAGGRDKIGDRGVGLVCPALLLFSLHMLEIGIEAPAIDFPATAETEHQGERAAGQQRKRIDRERVHDSPFAKSGSGTVLPASACVQSLRNWICPLRINEWQTEQANGVASSG